MTTSNLNACTEYGYSVVIPAFNSAKFIARTIESVRNQTFKAGEVIVVDDGSSDETVHICQALGVTVIKRQNGGPAAARNTGAQVARFPWIAFLDHDDIWLPQKSECQLAMTDERTDAVFCRKLGLPEKFGFDELFERNLGGSPSGTMIRKSVLLAMGGFDASPEIIGVEDYNFWLRFCLDGYRFKTSGQLFRFTPADGNYSGNSRKMFAAEVCNIEKIGSLAGISPERIELRIRRLCQHYLPDLISQRHLTTARQIVRKIGFQPTNMLHWAAFMPRSVLDLYRTLNSLSTEQESIIQRQPAPVRLRTRF